ncbi:PDR/VanB family oxidoreductase [Piscinibacter sp.]|uniref:PDR/VanB family oxidoreductase n=1 Tax=Piscinibacter sp. TaxID=1903157 RepID=UPI0039E4808E
MEALGPAPAITAAQKMVVQVRSTRYLTSSIKEFELVALDGSPLPAFDAGAHIDVLTGTKFYRSYSLVNDPAERDRYVIAVKYEPAGKGGSQFMHDFVDAGERLTILPPSNLFALHEGAGRSLLMAGGIGVTPIVCMVRRLQSQGADFEAHYLGGSLAEMAYHEELCALAPARMRLHVTGSQLMDMRMLVPAFVPGTHLYVCGPKGMIDAVREAAADWPADHVHFELFNSALGPRVIAEPAEPFEVELARSGRVLVVSKDQSLLQVLQAHGVDIGANCESGICGICSVPLLAGEADHRDNVLSAQERAHRIQTCVSRARPGQRLVLDC